MNILSLFTNLGDIKNKAPQLLAEFLDTLLADNMEHLQPEAGEMQIIYIMHPSAKKDDGKTQYNISIVALSGDNRILRVLQSITLDDAISVMLKKLPNA